MTGQAAQSPSAAPGPHLVLYDGVCGLCSRFVQFLLQHDRGAVFSFASLQSPLGRATVAASGGNPADLDSFYCADQLPHGRRESPATEATLPCSSPDNSGGRGRRCRQPACFPNGCSTGTVTTLSLDTAIASSGVTTSVSCPIRSFEAVSWSEGAADENRDSGGSGQVGTVLACACAR